MNKQEFIRDIQMWGFEEQHLGKTESMAFFRYSNLYFDWHTVNNEPVSQDFRSIYTQFKTSTLAPRPTLRAVN